MRGSTLKRLLVVGISTLLLMLDCVRTLYLRAIGRRPPVPTIVLLYHSVPPEHREGFARQMDIVARLARPIPADTRARLDPATRHVAVTFDDGLASFAQQAWPELEKRNIPATVFVVSGALGTQPSWVNYTPGMRPTESTLTADELRRLPVGVTIGAHSQTHPMLTELSAEAARDEIRGSRDALEALLERPVRLFSFPYGERSDALVKHCEEAGYERVFTSLPVSAFAAPDEFVTGRIDVRASEWEIEFRLKVMGAYRWLPYAFALKQAVLGVGLEAGRRRSTEVNR